jgi:HlyD family secretion protein
MAETQAPAASRRDAARVRRAKNRRRWIINIVVIIVVVAGIGAYLLTRHRGAQLPEGLVTATTGRTNLTQIVSATGSVTAQTGAMVKIGSQITGRIKYLYADVGGHVTAGQVIAELAVPDLEANVQSAQAALTLNQRRLDEQLAGVDLQNTQTQTAIDQARAGVAVAQANLNQVEQSANLQIGTAEAGVRQAQANATNSAANLKRIQQLFDEGFISASDRDNAIAQDKANTAQLDSAQENLRLVKAQVAASVPSAREQLKQAQAALAAAEAGVAQPKIKAQQIAQARASVRQSTAALAQAKAQYDKAFIRTPITGTVLQLAQQEGETIAAGLSAPTLIIVANLDKLQVDAFVDETDIGKVELGQKAEVTVDAYPNRSFYGRVAKIASGATMQQNVVTYDVTIALENPGHLLKPDMTATTDMTVAQRRDVLAVPVDAIKPGVHGSTVTVMTMQKGKPQFRIVDVQTGISDGENTEILSGLREGDTVVLAGQVPGMGTQSGGPRFRGMFGFGGRGGRSGGGSQPAGGGARPAGGGQAAGGGARPAGGAGGGGR